MPTQTIRSTTVQVTPLFYENTVFLEPNFKVGPGPKYHVYLVPKANIRSSADVTGTMFVDLGRLRSF